MVHAAQHGATEGDDVGSYRACSALEFHDVFEDRDLVQILGHQVDRVLPANYLGNSEIIQSDVLLDPQILDVRVLDVAGPDARGGRRIRVNDEFLLEVAITAQGSDAETDNASLGDSVVLGLARR